MDEAEREKQRNMEERIMIVKLGEQILTIREVLPQEDAFKYWFCYDPNQDIIFAKEKEKDGKTSRKSTTEG